MIHPLVAKLNLTTAEKIDIYNQFVEAKKQMAEMVDRCHECSFAVDFDPKTRKAAIVALDYCAKHKTEH